MRKAETARLIEESITCETEEVTIENSKEFGEQVIDEVEFRVEIRFKDSKNRFWIIDKYFAGYPELEK